MTHYPATVSPPDVVDPKDLLAVVATWPEVCRDPGCPPDFDGDGNVGILDLLTLLANWGPCG